MLYVQPPKNVVAAAKSVMFDASEANQPIPHYSILADLSQGFSLSSKNVDRLIDYPDLVIAKWITTTVKTKQKPDPDNDPLVLPTTDQKEFEAWYKAFSKTNQFKLLTKSTRMDLKGLANRDSFLSEKGGLSLLLGLFKAVNKLNKSSGKEAKAFVKAFVKGFPSKLTLWVRERAKSLNVKPYAVALKIKL